MPYPKTGNSLINRIIVDEYFKDIRNGFYIEAGACDGIFQSNTYYLETELGWTGILVEPNPEYSIECVKNRPNSTIYNCALVSTDFKDKTTTLYSIATKGAMGTVGNRGIWKDEKEVPIVFDDIKVSTLTEILDEINPKEIDFFSLDVEGYEVNVLLGLDFKKYKPKIMLIESFSDNIEKIKDITSDFYILDNKISDRDYVFILK